MYFGDFSFKILNDVIVGFDIWVVFIVSDDF